MHATFRQLQLFLAFAESGSISGAARACHITQPTVSMQLRELSEGMGFPLYEVIGKKTYLTDAGKLVRQSALAMREEWASLEQQLDGLRGLRRGRLRVSFVTTAKYFVPDLLGAFCRQYPEVNVELSVLNREGVLQRLRANEDDIYVMSQPPEDIDVICEAFLPNPLVPIAPLGHPLAKRRRADPEVIRRERLILREKGSGTRNACDRHFATLGWKPQLRMELGSNEAIKHAVSAGFGLSVLSRHALADDPASDGLAILKLNSFPIDSKWFIVQPRGKLLPPAATEFLAHLRDYVGQLPVRGRQIGK